MYIVFRRKLQWRPIFSPIDPVSAIDSRYWEMNKAVNKVIASRALERIAYLFWAIHPPANPNGSKVGLSLDA